MKANYLYAIVKENFKYLRQESAIFENDYKDTKYALIEKQMFKNGSEGINRIIYSNDLEELQNDAAKYVSWYNYPLNLTKNMQGYITNINR